MLLLVVAILQAMDLGHGHGVLCHSISTIGPDDFPMRMSWSDTDAAGQGRDVIGHSDTAQSEAGIFTAIYAVSHADYLPSLSFSPF